MIRQLIHLCLRGQQRSVQTPIATACFGTIPIACYVGGMMIERAPPAAQTGATVSGGTTSCVACFVD